MSHGVREQVRRIRLERRSTLFRWLYAHYDDLAPVLNVERPLRPPWLAVAKVFAQSPGGRVISRQTVMSTWPGVEAMKAEAGQQGAAARPRPTILPQSAPTTETTPAADADFPITDLDGNPI